MLEGSLIGKKADEILRRLSIIEKGVDKMTEELLSEAVAKMNEACKNTIRFKHYTRCQPERYWWILRAEVVQGADPVWKQYSPMMSLCQLVDWCEAWLRGAEEIIAIFDKEKLS